MVILKNNFQLKRIYEIPMLDDGSRILIDRLWPRGVAKEKAKVDLWLKEVAPSPELRKWFCHDPERFQDFREYYVKELQDDPVHQEQIKLLEQKLTESPVTLLYAAKDPVHNHAVVLHEFLKNRQGS